MSRLHRRAFLQLGAMGAIGSPLLMPRVARAKGAGTAPKRLIVFHHPQGTVLPMFAPTGSATSFSLSTVSEPLAPFVDRALFLTGLDNRAPQRNSVGNAHENSDYTVFTGRPFPVQDGANLTAAGPSFEQVLAAEIGGETAYPSIHLISGGRVSNGVTSSARFFYGPEDRVAGFNDPYVAALRLFGDSTISPEDAWALRARRSSVLDGVMQQFRHFRARLPAAERERLDAHEERVRQLESRISGGLGECSAPSFSPPPSYNPAYDDHVSASAMIDIGIAALSCDYTRVLTIEMANGHDHAFEWLWGENGGNPIVDTSQFDNWHAMVHADYQAGMEHVYRWYMELFAELLTKLDSTVDADGENMLDTSLVLWMPEFSSGRHWHNGIPAVVAGCMGDAQLGRWLDYHPSGVDSFVAANNYQDSGATTNQLFTSILQAFGLEDDSFGHVDVDMPAGPLPML